MTEWKGPPGLAAIGNELEALGERHMRPRRETIEKAIKAMVDQGEKPLYRFDRLDGQYFVFESGRTLRLTESFAQVADGYEITYVAEEVAPYGQTFTLRATRIK